MSIKQNIQKCMTQTTVKSVKETEITIYRICYFEIIYSQIYWSHSFPNTVPSISEICICLKFLRLATVKNKGSMVFGGIFDNSTVCDLRNS